MATPVRSESSIDTKLLVSSAAVPMDESTKLSATTASPGSSQSKSRADLSPRMTGLNLLMDLDLSLIKKVK